MSQPYPEELRFELSLTLGGKSFSIPGGQIKHLSARMTPHGFSASVTFWTSREKQDAPLFLAFQKPDLVQVKLSVAAVDPEESSPPPPLVLQGLVRSRRVEAQVHGTHSGGERVFRRYTLEFADAAQVLWRQHRPTELYTDISMAEVLDAHKASLQLSMDWTALQQKHAMLCLALGSDAPGVSFYDFVVWFVAANNGVFAYDSQHDEYQLLDSKPTSGTVAALGPLRVQSVQVRVPPPIRHATRVLNAVAVSPTTTPIDQAQAHKGVSHDVLLRTPLADEAELRQKLEKSRLQVRQKQVRIAFDRFPTVSVFPGALLKLESSLWPNALTGMDEDLRVLELELEAHATEQGEHAEQQSPVAQYEVRMTTQLESASEPVVSLPSYRTPRYPIHVEGLVFSPGGEATDRRWLLLEDEKTSVLTFRMTVPLWNKTVSVPAEPIHFPGEFYFPPYKNTRVLVELHYDRAELVRFIDWKEGVRTPQDGQGDQMLLGLNKTSQTGFTHDFQDDKPVWRMLRTSGGDTQVVRMSEGRLFIQVKESSHDMATTPTYDVSPQVDAAKGDLSASVGGAIGQTAAAYQSAMGESRAKMKSAQSEAKAAFGGARKDVGAKVAEARSGIQGASARLNQGIGELSSSAAAAKAALEKLR